MWCHAHAVACSDPTQDADGLALGTQCYEGSQLGDGCFQLPEPVAASGYRWKGNLLPVMCDACALAQGYMCMV
jgi:hypothetical protein